MSREGFWKFDQIKIILQKLRANESLVIFLFQKLSRKPLTNQLG